MTVMPARASVLRRIPGAVAALLCVLVAAVSFRYAIRVGYIPDVIALNALRVPWLVVHVAGAALALLIGPIQFSQRIRRRAPAVHRWIGRTYVAGCLLGGCAGLLLAFGASTGPITTTGFALLALAWILSTAQAWWSATHRRFTQHREWMLRSFALTFSAVTLRLYLAVLLLAPAIPFVQAYRAISFLCWVPNLLVVELYIRATRSRIPPAAALNAS
jgi:hypothetical protein